MGVGVGCWGGGLALISSQCVTANVAVFEVEASAFKAEKRENPTVKADTTATQSFAQIKSLGTILPYPPPILF